jgi:hypothetical protein
MHLSIQGKQLQGRLIIGIIRRPAAIYLYDYGVGRVNLIYGVMLVMNELENSFLIRGSNIEAPPGSLGHKLG